MSSKELLKDFSFEDVIKEAEELEPEEIVGKKNNNRTEIDYQIKKVYGQLSKRRMAPIFSLVNWNGYERFDLRPWRGDMSTPGKGVTFTGNELKRLIACLEDFNFEPPGAAAKPIAFFSTPNTEARIYNSICVISESSSKGQLWRKEVLWIDWGHGQKVDIRKWTDSYQKCSRGISMPANEFQAFYDLICDL